LVARKRATSDTGRLDAQAWTIAALEMLAEEGIDGVRIEMLAKRLNVTKGSFYWHFKDRDALLNAMLDHWRRTSTLSLIDWLDSAIETPRHRLSALLERPIQLRDTSYVADVDLSIRLWGRRDENARVALAEVDELRMRYITQLIARCGAPEGEARARAILAYSYIRVAATLMPADAEALMAQCTAIVLGEPASPVTRPRRSPSGTAP
jgi:AcrR family transcriptional regulator